MHTFAKKSATKFSNVQNIGFEAFGIPTWRHRCVLKRARKLSIHTSSEFSFGSTFTDRYPTSRVYRVTFPKVPIVWWVCSRSAEWLLMLDTRCTAFAPHVPRVRACVIQLWFRIQLSESTVPVLCLCLTCPGRHPNKFVFENSGSRI